MLRVNESKVYVILIVRKKGVPLGASFFSINLCRQSAHKWGLVKYFIRVF